MILDTSFLHDVMHDDEAAIKKASEIEADGSPVHIAAVTAYELYYGIERVEKSAAERERVNRVLDRFPLVDADRPIMQKAGRIDAQLDASGQPLDDLADVLIGATAATLEESILTRNVDHFERMQGVDVVTY